MLYVSGAGEDSEVSMTEEDIDAMAQEIEAALKGMWTNK